MANQQEIVELQAPVGGLNRATDYQSAPPYTSIDLLNVRPFDVLEGRGRIGSRPGLVKAYTKQLGDANEGSGGAAASGGPTSITPTRDVYLRQALSTNRDALGLRIANDANGADDTNSILYFDLSGIPSTATITAAKLVLFAITLDVPSFSGVVYRLTRTNWSETQATWSLYSTGNSWTTAGGDYDSSLSVSFAIRALGTNEIFGMEALCQDAIDSPTYQGQLHILLTTNLTADAVVEFVDSEYATAAYRPTLVVEYTSGGSFTSTPVRMVAECQTLSSNTATTYFDDFAGSSLSGTYWEHASTTWTLPDFVSDTPRASVGLPTVSSGLARSDTSANQLRTASSKITGASVDSRREVSLSPYTMPIDSSVWIIMDTSESTPAISGSVAVRFTIFGSGLAELILYVNGVVKASYYNPTEVLNLERRQMRMVIHPWGKVQVWWTKQTPDINYTIPSYSPAGRRYGFGLHNNAANDGVLIRSISFLYTVTASTKPPNMLMASANGYLEREGVDGVMYRVTHVNIPSLRSDRLISAIGRLQKLYIADYGVRQQRLASSSSATIANVSGSTSILDDSGVTDWTQLGIDVNSDRLEIISASGGTPAPVGVYAIVSVHATNGVTFTISGGPTATSVSYRIIRGPKIYDSATDQMALTSLGTVGISQFPVGFRHFSLWADRIVAVNDPTKPQQWQMSAVGYPNLWDFGDGGTVNSDGVASGTLIGPLIEAAAASDSASGSPGKLGDPIICTIPISNDHLIFACRASFSVLRGNPLLNGTINLISRDVGILDIGAYARTPEGRLIVMTLDGLYEVTLVGVIPLSRDVIPEELLGIDPELYEVTLGYDYSKRGICIACVPRSSSDNSTLKSIHYYYDIRSGGFFLDEYALGHDTTASCVHQVNSVGPFVLVRGCRDGYLRMYDDGSGTDDGTGFDSRVWYGPIRLGSGTYGEGYINELVDVLDSVSDNVTVRIYGGDTAQEARLAEARYETRMTAGRNRNRRPRLRYSAIYIETEGTPGRPWARESMTITRQKTGRLALS
ncbi:DNRLRE domain-containing protein [Nitrospira sp. BLG_1]|uniref:DNRLRE domain-containing protein n=1 Tax=Nitrospira sp. BLG_1 TaxID=3395883 RepID=UPI0039BCA2DF